MLKKITVLILVLVLALSTTFSFAGMPQYTLSISTNLNRVARNNVIQISGEVLVDGNPKVGTDVTLKVESVDGQSIPFVDQ
ncbi:hypothetical protein JYU11_03780, partial [bacterium AH-315-G05]|nr:hypothetical protein [bacterium AH-315-G05]